ncbi:bifunctional 4-hydroxy-2-oxoglutarate aldolase/2-dehydro-3-deoxy-phosphogluconate aldolase [Alteromonas sp. PRIM-21]|uniref:bifunctional 4-hydroxy-2-oxoglutarate aldolase/2-dehydro-3-deoxy-phosphogluconate aldolase n=1 Tax=Alteromonas sp. PRIM-21 TaxID=1454978 RepID=UPI0022B9C210|nr:bifunctional 4-hydroxy-2-oxoglutarate aldolase/2-dehydro-3-deoxy-phosphogluconate aldolase [Alteromonas sp. PRIM-21]MCZ8528732.1 bifunctional 4-hydroxy-2-oxoglutarate aldolase/2-dehydro-3-deoxy-phosphogluconate aldolase [Alteromonas sp. PRIM-21]
MKKISDIMGGQTLLPIIQADNVEDGVAIAKAMSAAGLNTVEVVLRSENSAKCITAIKEAMPEMIVSAGTVIDKASLDAAINAGADFIVTPAVTERLLTMLVDSGLPVLPGVSNVSDIVLAREHGFREMKLFPASLSGGASFLKAVGGLFKDTKFCPTGGVSPENFNDYLSLGNVFAAGGTWVAKPQWVADKQWNLITEACSQV